MGKGFSTLDPQDHQGKTDTWLTPLPIIKSLGEFDLDPCGFIGHSTAKTILVPPADGLELKWSGRVWMNPPYGRDVDKWIQKLRAHGNGIALLFARTDTKWFHDADPNGILFLRGRIKFLKPDLTESTNAGHGSMLLAYGKENVQALWRSNLKGIIWT